MSSSSPITFSGVGSGIDVDSLVTRLMAVERKPLDDLNARKNKINLRNTQYDNLVSRVTSLSNAIRKITTPTIGATDLFSTRTSTVSAADALSVTATGEATPQTFSVSVNRLATATKAVSLSNLGQWASASSSISAIAQGRITAGNFTVFVNGNANTVAVNSTDTLSDVLTRIGGLSGIASATIGTDGKISVTAQSGNNLSVGASGDTSNFLDLAGLKTGTLTGNTLTSGLALSTLNPNADITTAGLATPITVGSQFTIGKASFTISAGKTLNALMAEINANTDAGVVASYNASSNKLELTSRTSGNSFITLQDQPGGNALAALGLIAPGGDSTASQTQGLTAQFAINGGPVIQSSSNTVSDALTGLTGITLNLTKANPSTPIQVTVNNSTTDLKAALRETITQLNSTFTFIAEQTNSQSTSAQLKNDGTILRFRSEVRTALTSAVSGLTGPFNNLAAIGISTGAVTGSGGLNSTYILDESKLDAALASNPDNVKQLLTGTNGILTQLGDLVSSALDTTNDPSKTGIFAKRKTADQDRIKALNDAISRAQTRLDNKEKLYRQQFQQMDSLIASYQSQSRAIARIGTQS